MNQKCGVDIVEISRIKKAITSTSLFKEKVFTEKEIEYCENKKKSKYQSYAARFAAKEAISKALGPGLIKEIAYRKIEIITDLPGIINDLSGKPQVKLHKNAERIFSKMIGTSIDISLSHCKEYAVAMCTIQYE